jgi:hypothetical protein
MQASAEIEISVSVSSLAEGALSSMLVFSTAGEGFDSVAVHLDDEP